jgi:aspartate/methionine/tyrosine aminotransferase
VRPYSQRLPWSSPNNFSLRVAARRATGHRLLDLTISNPTQVLANYPHLEIAAAYGSVHDFTYRPEPFGDSRAREAIAAYYAAKGIAVSEDRIALTASTSEAYSLLFKLLCDPGDEILVPVPSYPLFEHLAALESVRTVSYHLRYAGEWFVDLDDLASAITPRTRVVVIVNPSNPSGCYSKEHEARAILDIAARHQLALIIDEVFFDFPIAQERQVTPSYCTYQQALTFVLNGMSKLAGMPQMKLGWIVLNGPREQQAEARQRLELILDTYLSVATPVQRAAPQLLEAGAEIRRQLQQRVSSNLMSLQERLRPVPANCLTVEGGWSAIVQLPEIISEENWILGLLDEASVIVQPGYFFDIPSEPFIVVSLITPCEIFSEGITDISEFVSKIAN